MSFERAWLLLLLLAPAIWFWRSWPQTTARERVSLALKAATLALIVLALAAPHTVLPESKVALSVLVDTSSSLSNEDLRRAATLTDQLESSRGRHRLRVLPFARGTRPPLAEERAAGGWKFRPTSGEAGRSTDLELAVREGISALPEGLVPRLALISDGRENRGSILRAAWQARQLGIPIDTFALSGRAPSALRLESAALPPQAFAGEKFTVDLVISSPRAAQGKLTVSAAGRQLGESPVRLEAGENQIRANAVLSEPGAIDLTGTVSAEGLGEVRFAESVTLKRPRVLYVSQDPPGSEANLRAALEAGRFELVDSDDASGGDLDSVQIAVLNNIDLDAIPRERQEALERFVEQGGGLLIIGGEKNVYLEKKNQPETPLERTLPAKLAPPRSPEGTCVVLIMDKSSSMEGRKMELERLAAIGVIENLRAIDLVGVLIFDNSFQWAVPIRKAEDRTLIKRLVAGVTPDGGTQIAPALAEAFRRTVPVKATFKHIVLLTDGISEEGDSMNVAREAINQKITISTVGLGQDVNKAYLEKIASTAKGKSYFLVDPSGLEQILLKDVMEHTGSTAIERAIKPVVLRPGPLFDGVPLDSAPSLNGYVKFKTKPTAEALLAVTGGSPAEQDPLLARWQYGLGRAAVFTSDAKSRWADQWVTWSGFAPFWENIFRDLLPHAQAGEARVELERASNTLVVEYRLGRFLEEPKSPPAIFAMGPENFQQPVPLVRAAAGLYRGRVAIGERRGMFRVRPLAESRAFPEIGFYREEEELRETGANEALLRQVAEFTGGRFNPSPSNVFDAGGKSVQTTMHFWPFLLGLAVLLNLGEVVWRKWPSLTGARASD